MLEAEVEEESAFAGAGAYAQGNGDAGDDLEMMRQVIGPSDAGADE